MRKINRIILHQSASSFGNAALINEWHLKIGWDSIGYHYVITNGLLRHKNTMFDRTVDGLVESGRPVAVEGAHVFGHNADSIGICLIGISSYTHEQLLSLYKLLKTLRLQYDFPEILQHSDLDKKKPHCACLSDRMMEFLRGSRYDFRRDAQSKE